MVVGVFELDLADDGATSQVDDKVGVQSGLAVGAEPVVEGVPLVTGVRDPEEAGQVGGRQVAVVVGHHVHHHRVVARGWAYVKKCHSLLLSYIDGSFFGISYCNL